MDSNNLATAKGLPCAFEQYEIYRNGTCQIVENGIPTARDHIRFDKSDKKSNKVNMI